MILFLGESIYDVGFIDVSLNCVGFVILFLKDNASFRGRCLLF